MANYTVDSLNLGDNKFTFTTPYGTCSTAAATAIKIVECPNFLSLEEGARITVAFSYENTSTNPKLNVNNTGAVQISGMVFWPELKTFTFVYNGQSWVVEKPHYRCRLLGSMTGSTNSTITVDDIEGYQFIFITDYETSGTLNRGMTMIPVDWLKGNYGTVLGMETWDGARYRLKFERVEHGSYFETKFTITAAWYAGTVYIYGIE